MWNAFEWDGYPRLASLNLHLAYSYLRQYNLIPGFHGSEPSVSWPLLQTVDGSHYECNRVYCIHKLNRMVAVVLKLAGTSQNSNVRPDRV